MKSSLERYEKAHASTHLASPADYDLILERLAVRPESLGERDECVLEYFGSVDDVTRARAARDAATPRVDPPPAAAADEDRTPVAAVLTRLAAFMRDMNNRNKQRNARLDALEQRLATLEARPEVHDAGVWESGKTYNPGAIVSHSGSGWICRTTHVAFGSEPNYAAFRLFVKRGQNAPKGDR